MARGIVIGSAAVAASVGALVYPAGSFLPGFLVGSYGDKTAGPTSTAPAGAKTLTGDPIETNYGTVQVAIVVENKKITDVQVLQSPVGPNQRTAITPFRCSKSRHSLLKARTSLVPVVLRTPQAALSNRCNLQSRRCNSVTHQKCTFEAIMRFVS